MGTQRIRLAGLSAQKYHASSNLHAKERQEVSTYDTELTLRGLERKVIVPELEIATLKSWKRRVAFLTDPSEAANALADSELLVAP